MSRLRINCFAVSADGYGAGPAQSLEQPLGVGGEALHEWFIPTRTFRAMLGGGDGGTTGVDDEFAAAGIAGLGAWILGRNMFGPVRGPWPDDKWKGWWGPNPPYHVPVFVLTHHPRAPIEMEGGTTFHFVTDGIHAALERAKAAAGGKDVRVGGGVATVREYALSLPEAAEAPHFQYASFRVRGKIFATVPPGNEYLHVFVPEPQREPALTLHPEFLEKLHWGGKVVGLRATLAPAKPGVIRRLLGLAWESKAPRSLATAFAASQGKLQQG